MRRLLSYWYSFIRQKPSTGVAPIWRTAFNRGQKGSRGKDYQSHWHRFEWFTAGSAGAPLLGFSFVTTFRDMIGMPPFQLDKDPLKHKVKEVSAGCLWSAALMSTGRVLFSGGLSDCECVRLVWDYVENRSCSEKVVVEQG